MTQPEALRLADELTRYLGCGGTASQAATELRRLHAENDALLSALRWIATVNAMDYEYQKVARDAIKSVEEGK